MREFRLYLLLVLISSLFIYQNYQLRKATVCNKVFVAWFKHNLGINVNLDKLYEDGKKWVDDSRYQ